MKIIGQTTNVVCVFLRCILMLVLHRGTLCWWHVNHLTCYSMSWLSSETKRKNDEEKQRPSDVFNERHPMTSFIGIIAAALGIWSRHCQCWSVERERWCAVRCQCTTSALVLQTHTRHIFDDVSRRQSERKINRTCKNVRWILHAHQWSVFARLISIDAQYVHVKQRFNQANWSK
jgi:hypothetical protein